MRGVATLSAAALGAAGLVALTPVAANAAVSGGTVTLTVKASFISQLAHSGVAIVPSNAASVTFNSDGSVTIVYNATGGDANLVQSAGSINYTGGILGFSVNRNGFHSVSLGSLLFDLTDSQFDGATSTSGETPLVDLAGSQFGLINGSTQSYSASDLQVDAAGAALLDSALHTSAFAAGQSVGSFTTTWTVS